MLSDKQGKLLATILSVGSCYISYLLAMLFILQWPRAWLRAALQSATLNAQFVCRPRDVD